MVIDSELKQANSRPSGNIKPTATNRTKLQKKSTYYRCGNAWFHEGEFDVIPPIKLPSSIPIDNITEDMADHDIEVLASHKEGVFNTWVVQKEWGSIFRKRVIRSSLDSLCDKHVFDIDEDADDEYTMQSSSIPKFKTNEFLVKPQDILDHIKIMFVRDVRKQNHRIEIIWNPRYPSV